MAVFINLCNELPSSLLYQVTELRMYGSWPWRTINDDNTAAVVSFNDYMTETWIEGHFEFWNHFDHDGPRTTNAVERWHHKLNRMCRHAYPNIYVFIEMLQKEQATNEAKIIQINAGGGVRLKKRKYR